MTSLVVGHSRDPASQEALRIARDLARRLDACLHVVHGIDLGDYPIDPDAADWEEQGERTLAEERDQVQAALASCPQRWTYSATRGDPVSLISATAEESDALMIVVGTRGEGLGPAIERLLCGSVSHGLIRRQNRPVLVVRVPRVRRATARKASGAIKENAVSEPWKPHRQHRAHNRLANYIVPRLRIPCVQPPEESVSAEPRLIQFGERQKRPRKDLKASPGFRVDHSLSAIGTGAFGLRMDVRYQC